jgi:hypothetical protein
MRVAVRLLKIARLPVGTAPSLRLKARSSLRPCRTSKWPSDILAHMNRIFIPSESVRKISPGAVLASGLVPSFAVSLAALGID